VQRLLVRHGLGPADDATGPADRLADESPVLAGIVGASVQGRVALGPRAGARVRRVGDARDTAAVTSRGARQAHLEGFDLHANVRVAANDRAGLERLCRYILRPPFAQERLRLRSDRSLSQCVRREVEDHLREAVAADPEGNGPDAERRAVANFGDPRLIAAQFAAVALARQTRKVGAAVILVIAGVFVAMKARDSDGRADHLGGQRRCSHRPSAVRSGIALRISDPHLFDGDRDRLCGGPRGSHSQGRAANGIHGGLAGHASRFVALK
jgi:hypothetical protein